MPRCRGVDQGRGRGAVVARPSRAFPHLAVTRWHGRRAAVAGARAAFAQREAKVQAEKQVATEVSQEFKLRKAALANRIRAAGAVRLFSLAGLASTRPAQRASSGRLRFCGGLSSDQMER